MTDLVVHEPSAQLNVTINGQNGNYPDPVGYDLDDEGIREIVKEGLLDGFIPGVDADPEADLADFVVDRFPATAELPPRIFLRPKTPFGGLYKCPMCGYFAFDGAECFDCGFRI